MPRKPAHQQFDTLKALQDQAFELFGRYGYDGVSIGDIAVAANLSKGALYWHYADKHALYLEGLKHLHGLFDRYVFDPMRAEADPARAILGLFRGLENLVGDAQVSQGVAGFWLVPAREETSEFAEMQRAFELRSMNVIEEKLRAGVASGQFDLGGDLEDFSRAVISLGEAVILPLRHQSPEEVRPFSPCWPAPCSAHMPSRYLCRRCESSGSAARIRSRSATVQHQFSLPAYLQVLQNPGFNSESAGIDRRKYDESAERRNHRPHDSQRGLEPTGQRSRRLRRQLIFRNRAHRKADKVKLMRIRALMMLILGGLIFQPAFARDHGHSNYDGGRGGFAPPHQDFRREPSHEQQRPPQYQAQQRPPQYQEQRQEPFRGDRNFGRPAFPPGQFSPRFSPGDAAQRAQQMNGGGRILAVDPNGPGYRVKVLKEGEVRVISVPGG